ncbi:MAG: hypothetical protein JNG89_18905 [Planctomycetaceae bacterium]|nr:hypothetical protein [Planctomycetaceae bacterium]
MLARSATRNEHAPEACWTVVARFANAAEAGYFANELDYVLGIEPRLDCRDDFDAAQHHWRSGYVLSVPESLAERARMELRDLLAGERGAASGRDDRIPASAMAVGFGRREVLPGSEKPVTAVKWGPLFLTLAAGSLVIWHGKKPAVQRQPADPQDAPRISLYDAPGLRAAPWVQQSGDGVRRELDFNGPGPTAVLREDRDGDGAFEREYPIRIGD